MKGVRKIVVTKVFRPQGDTRGHVSLSRATVIVVERGIDTSCIECRTVDQKATHREVSAWEAPTFLDLDLTDEVLTIVGDFLHVSLTYLLLEHVIPRGCQPRGASVTTTWLSIRLLARLEAKGERSGLPLIPTPKRSLTGTVHQLSRGHLAELVLDLSSSKHIECTLAEATGPGLR